MNETLRPEDISSLSDSMEKIISIIPALPATISILSSSTIIHFVRKAKFDTAYRRILFGLSVSDILVSLSFALSPFLLPSQTSQRVWAAGNPTTCSFLGTLTQLSSSSLLYCGALSYYYLFTIRYGVSEENFSKKYEPFMHIFAAGWPIGTAAVGAIMGFYHETDLGPGCWVASYPEGCRFTEEIECTSPMIAWIYAGILIFLMLISIVVNNCLIYFHVRKFIKRSMSRALNSTVQSRRISLVAGQAFLYVTVFFTTTAPSVALRIIEGGDYTASAEGPLFPLLLLQALLAPSTGFFNLCIYLRPRISEYRSSRPLATWLESIQYALTGEINNIPMNNSRIRSTSANAASSQSQASDGNKNAIPVANLLVQNNECRQASDQEEELHCTSRPDAAKFKMVYNREEQISTALPDTDSSNERDNTSVLFEVTEKNDGILHDLTESPNNECENVFEVKEVLNRTSLPKAAKGKMACIIQQEQNSADISDTES